jgi:hypothetical protein
LWNSDAVSRWAVLSTTENYEDCALKEWKNVDFQVWWELRSSVLLRKEAVSKRRQKNTATRCVIIQKNACLIFFAAKAWNHAYQVSYHLFSFGRSVQDYKIHTDMEIVPFLWIKRRNKHRSLQQSYGPVQYLRFQHITNYLV